MSPSSRPRSFGLGVELRELLELVDELVEVLGELRHLLDDARRRVRVTLRLTGLSLTPCRSIVTPLMTPVIWLVPEVIEQRLGRVGVAEEHGGVLGLDEVASSGAASAAAVEDDAPVAAGVAAGERQAVGRDAGAVVDDRRGDAEAERR